MKKNIKKIIISTVISGFILIVSGIIFAITVSDNKKINDYNCGDFTLQDIKILYKKDNTLLNGVIKNNTENKYAEVYLKVSIKTKEKKYNNFIKINDLDSMGETDIELTYKNKPRNVTKVTMSIVYQTAIINNNE